MTAPAPARVATARHGLWDALPLVPGVAAFAVVYGVVARQAGLSLAATIGMSALVFAGAAQFTAVSMWAQASPLLVVLTTFIINLRHLLMGASIAPHVRGVPGAWKGILAFGMADETYALAIARYLRGDGSPSYFLGVNAAVYAAWVLAGAVGAWAGGSIPDPSRWGIGLVFPLTFLGLLVPLLTNRVTLLVAAASALAAVLGAPWLAGKANILLAIVVGSAAGAILEGWWPTSS